MNRTSVRVLLIAFALVVPFCGYSFSAPPTLEGVALGVGQRGTEFTLTITGARLNDPQELMMYAPGVVCTKLTAKGENEVTATLKSAPDCKLGEYPFRLRTKGGVSELRTFRVSPFPVVPEKEPNDTREQAQSVPPNVSVAGVVESGGSDYFAVALKKGQRLAAEIEGVRMGGELNDTAIAVFGPDGKQLAAVDDTPLFRQDPFVTALAPSDGTYVVQVHDTNFGGGDTHRYVLHIGTFTRPGAVFPAGGQAGTEVAVKLFGDATGDRTERVTLPKAGAPFEFYPSDLGGTAPTPNPFRVSAFPNVNEVEPNNELKQASAATGWPVAFNGIIEKPGDADHFRFRAKKGDVIDVQAFAFRVGSPLDTVVAVLDAGSEVIGANDDDETHDSRLLVAIPVDGEYFVRVTDKRKQGGSAFIYRIELNRPQTGLAVFLPERNRKTQNRNVITVPRGNRVTAYLAVRRDGFTGPVTLATSALPTGVKVGLSPIPAEEYLLPVVFEAAADAPLGGNLIDLSGTGGEPKSPITGGFTQQVTLVRGPGDSALHAVTLTQLAIVVVEESPLSVSIVPPAAPIAADGTLDVTVRITRAKDFADPVEVIFPCLPPGVEVPTAVLIPANKTEAVVTLVASKDAELGDWKLIAEANVARPGRAARDPLAAPMGMGGMGAGGGGGGRWSRRSPEGMPSVASEMHAVKLAEAPLRGKFDLTAGEQGKSVKVVCKFDGPPLKGNFTAKLDGLPPRATSKEVQVQADAKQVEFTVAIDATTPPGTHASLVCELVGTVGGQKAVYRLGRDGTLKVDVPGAVKTDAAGKPLSPLDALRLEQKKK
ncbi:Probable serine proteinase, subtilase family OS=Planctomyces maris DSM 8797 GN=PM8797T_03955 PE=4 SV=1: PPC [Gemmata massiliana]|uniref:Peptidase C-terminal archaeal/bacterial domain-containing protein n=1 Tax=Gemmata massiliana TaxID=1210884 RepID=A0A6P2D0V5_9BACT|nr:PPC domain-containing protein [Gemmata massiliana]VTR93995.1 Probable serine proteinase, subtilase family OS=Planctomyces maris DSM 8797 GN=PM8797T_03955 PE=4 SV=1: PPC [Gemmata massiliana]